MVGRAVSLFPKVETPIGEVLLEVEGLTRTGVFRDVSFDGPRTARSSGFAGLVGAGRTEVARVLFGIDQPRRRRRSGWTARRSASPARPRR